MPGHVFVLRGDVTHLRCDARLVPVHTDHLPKPAWLRGREGALRDAAPPCPPGWPADRRAWLLGAADDGGPALWVTQVGLDARRDVGWAMASVRAYLDAALAHAQATAAARPAGRAVPLLALHLVASGRRNAPRALGELAHLLLDTVGAFAAAHAADVAVVVRDEAEHAALQAARLRRPGSWAGLPEPLAAVADRLAEETRRGGLCVLTGAGVSAGAGLPRWAGLLEALAQRAGVPAAARAELLANSNPLQQASAILEHYDGDRAAFTDAIAALCAAPRVALAHALLANLPVSEYVTLNYDTLLEEAAADAGRKLDVLPHGRHGTGNHWLLKLHGCRTRPRDIVLTEEDFDTYDHRREAFAGIVQALLVTRHMLFVGFGLADPNISRLLRAVERALRDDAVMHDRALGTILTLDEPSHRSRPWARRFAIETVRGEGPGGGDVAARARLLELALDRLAARASDPHTHLLDPRFDALLDDRERAARRLAERFARDLAREAGGTAAATQLVAHLQSMGLRTDGPDEASAGRPRADAPAPARPAADVAPSRAAPPGPLPIVAVADLHGHLATFERTLAHWDRELGPDYRLVLLGDYVDNGPDTPGLLSRLVALEQERGDRFVAILGNHDLACLRSMGWEGGPPDEAWFGRWSRRYWNPGGGTAAAYGATSGAALAAKMPAAHRAFLQARPWCAEVEEHVFVHAGFHPGPLEPQVHALAARPLLADQQIVDPLRNKALACVADPAWTRTVVSAHTKYPLDRAAGGARLREAAACWPHFVGPRRITLSANVDEDGVLWSVLLPERRFVSVDARGAVATLAG